MDSRRFDMLTRRLAGSTTRRGMLRTAATAIVAGGALATVSDANALQRRTCRPLAAGCVSSAQCCSGLCDRRSSTPRRQRNRCACPEGTITCEGGTCVEPGTMEHCEGCTPCDETVADHCMSGVCMCNELPACDGGTSCCGADGCKDLQTDDNNCGACGNICPQDTYCEDGACACDTIAPADICVVNTDGTVDQMCSRFTWSLDGGGCETDSDCGPCPQGSNGCSCITGFREYGDFMSVYEWSEGSDHTFCMAHISCG